MLTGEIKTTVNCGGWGEIGTARARAMVGVGVGFLGGSEDEVRRYL